MKHLTVALLESTVSEQSLLPVALQFENLKGERFQTADDSIASNQITSVALCIQWSEDSIFLGIVLSIPESLHHQGETYHNSRKFGSLSHWPSFLTVRHHGKRKVTNVSNKGRWFSKLSFQMYHVADIYLINPIVCVYSFPQPQIPETLPHNIHCPGPESLAFVRAVGSSLHLHRTLLVLCNEGLDGTMTSIPWKLSRVVYEGKLVTYTQCAFFFVWCLYTVSHFDHKQPPSLWSLRTLTWSCGWTWLNPNGWILLWQEKWYLVPKPGQGFSRNSEWPVNG